MFSTTSAFTPIPSKYTEYTLNRNHLQDAFPVTPQTNTKVLFHPYSGNIVTEVEIDKKEMVVVPAVITRDAETNTFMILTDNSTIAEIDDVAEENTSPPPSLLMMTVDSSPKQNNPWIAFYVASLSVVGLFIVYRMAVQKAK